MLVGEAPGRNEDQIGTPFVGKAGKILDNVLRMTGIDRSQIYITNIVKCRPPHNRKPKSTEVMSCRMYLNREIAVLKPRIIGLLGRTAYSTLIGGNGFRSTRGQILEKNGQSYFITFHPAAALYNKAIMESLSIDFTKLSFELGLK
jgi:DNA polymerase